MLCLVVLAYSTRMRKGRSLKPKGKSEAFMEQKEFELRIEGKYLGWEKKEGLSYWDQRE